jgi:hypothetical protein
MRGAPSVWRERVGRRGGERSSGAGAIAVAASVPLVLGGMGGMGGMGQRGDGAELCAAAALGARGVQTARR